MKKNAIQLLLITFLCGCGITRYPLNPGVYESIEITENGYFSKAKYIMNEIDEQAYFDANSINVIKDGGTSGIDQKYYSFDLYFYLDSLDIFVKIETRYFNFKRDSSSVYTAGIKYYSDEFSISKSIVFDSHHNIISWSEERDNTTYEMHLSFLMVH